MSRTGWKQLMAGAPWFHGPGKFPIIAYSEFMPPPRLGRKPYGAINPSYSVPTIPWDGTLPNTRKTFELRPGLRHLAGELLTVMEHLGNGRPMHGISKAKLEGNPYWPPELVRRAGTLSHERYVIIAPLGIVADPRRQRPRALDAFRRQRTRAGKGFLARIFHGPRPGDFRGRRPWIFSGDY